MISRRSMIWISAALACLAAVACANLVAKPIENQASWRKLPLIGGYSGLQTEAVRSIKSITVHRIALMPVVEAPDKTGSVIAGGAGESITAELYSEMALVGGWELVPDSDVAQALQKLPPTTPANEEQNATELGRQVSADAVLYGTVERYKERVGLDYAAASPAAVSFTLHLLDMKTKQIIWTAKFSKTQKALSENVLNLVNFLQNSARWVRANEIAQEGAQEAVADLQSRLALEENIKRFETGTYREMKEGANRYGGH
jgi:hypothetical protein